MVQTLITDEHGNQLACHINKDDLLFIEVGELGENHDSGFIVLNFEDCTALIGVLKKALPNLKHNG